MNRIWHVKWYCEDDYGDTKAISVILQGDLTNIQAQDDAKSYLKKERNMRDQDFNIYKNFSATDVTAQKVLVSYFHM